MHSGTMFQNVSRQCFLKFHLFPWYSWLNPNFDTTPRPVQQLTFLMCWTISALLCRRPKFKTMKSWRTERKLQSKRVHFGGGNFLFFQSGACFLVICYIWSKNLYFLEFWSWKLSFALFIDLSMVLLNFSIVLLDLSKMLIKFWIVFVEFSIVSIDFPWFQSITCTWWTCRI